MSTNDFKTFLVEPPLISDITDCLSYGVLSGGECVVYLPYQSTTSDVSTIQVTANIPSLGTVVDRRLLLESTVQLKITGTCPLNTFLINYGFTDALGPFPLNSLFSSCSVTINGYTNTVQSQQILAPLLRLHDSRTLSAFNSTCPTAFDQYYQYADGLSANNNSLGAFNNSGDYDLLPRGAFNLLSISPNINAQPGTFDVPAQTASPPVSQTLYITFRTVEPLFCVSPFTLLEDSGAGMYGLNNVTLNCTIGSANRVWRSANQQAYGMTCTVVGFNNTSLRVCQNTLHPTKMISSKNVHPFYQINQYSSNALPSIGAWGSGNETQTLYGANITLQNIPDMIMIFARKQFAQQTIGDSDSFLALNNVSINFNNNSGILSSCSREQLYMISRECGYNGSFYEWSGFANTYSAGNAVNIVPTSGSVLCVRPCQHLQVASTYLAPGSIGSFNFQAQVNVTNQSDNAYTAGQIELVYLVVSSGILVNNNGTTASFVGILSPQMVIDTVSQQKSYSTVDKSRMVGGGIFGDILSGISSVAKNVLPIAAPIAKNLLANSSNPYAKTASSLLGSLGFGNSGSGYSGGGISGAGSSGAGVSGGKKKKNARLMHMIE